MNIIQRIFQRKKETHSDEPPKGEVATSEQGFFSGDFETFRGDELLMIRGNGIYREMQGDDQIEAALDLVNAALIGRRWSFEITDPDSQEIIAEIFEYNLNRVLKGTLGQLLTFMLTSRVEGFSLVEKIFGTFEKDGVTYWGLESYKLRPPETFTFVVDKHSNVTDLIQDQEGDRESLDINKFIHTVNKPEINIHYGRSSLFPAYRHWWSKLNLFNFWNMFTERAGGGFMIANVEGGLTKEQRSNLQLVLSNLQTATSIMAPKGVTFEYVMPNDTRTFENHIKIRNAAILRSLLVPSLIGFSDEAATGSEARAKVQMEAWFLILDKLAQGVADILNEQLFRELSVWNFGTVDFPLFKFESLTQEQKEKFAEKWITATKEGAVVNTFEDELRLRDVLHFPPREEDAEGINQDRELPEDTTPDDFPDEVPDGINPLSTATDWVENQFEDRQAIQRRGNPPNTMQFESRMDFNQIKEILFQERAKVYGQELFLGLDAIYEQLTVDMVQFSQGDQFEKVEDIQINPKLEADTEKAVFTQLVAAFEEGRAAGAIALNNARKDHNLPQEPIPEPRSPEQVGASFSAKAQMELFGLDIETAEEFISIQALQSVSKASTQVLEQIRQAIINGLVNELSVENMIINATRALEPLIGKRDDEGNLLIDIEAGQLPARISTIVNTTLTAAYNEGLRSFFEAPEQEGFVQAYQYSAIMDDRTTVFCRNANGRIWPIESDLWKKYLPPNHFNCRSIIIPVVIGDQWTTSLDVPKVDPQTDKPIEPAPGFD